MTHWLHTVPSYAWVVLITPMIVALIARAAARPGRRVEGWEILTPGIGMTAIGILALPMALAFAFGFIAGIAGPPASPHGRTDWMLLMLAAPPLTLMMVYTAGYIFLVQVSFNETHVHRRFLGRDSVHDWSDVAQIDRHWFYGPRLRLADGSTIQVWEYLRGFNDLLAVAERHGILVEI